MPIAACANSAGTLLVLRLFRTVTAKDLVSEQARAALEACRGSGFHILLLFDPEVDLSMLDVEAVKAVRQNRRQHFEASGLNRLGGAAVIDDQSDASMILPLWNAMNESDPGLDLSFRIFPRIGEALGWLGFESAESRQLIAQTGFQLAG